jgi:hypothetical protein
MSEGAVVAVVAQRKSFSVLFVVEMGELVGEVF